MENRLREIQLLFQKEQVKREKEALIWASAANNASGDKKLKNSRLEKQSRNILGKSMMSHNESSLTPMTSSPSPTGSNKKKIKVLTGNEKIKLPKRNNNLQKFIQNQKTDLKLKLGSRKKSRDQFSLDKNVISNRKSPKPEIVEADLSHGTLNGTLSGTLMDGSTLNE